MQRRLLETNPNAFRDMVTTFLEANGRGYWDTDDDNIEVRSMVVRRPLRSIGSYSELRSRFSSRKHLLPRDSLRSSQKLQELYQEAEDKIEGV